MNVVPDTLVMVHPWCVHVAVITEKVSCEIRATSSAPGVDCTIAVPPTVASDPLVIGTVTTRPDTVPFSVGRLEPLEPPLGDGAAATTLNDGADGKCGDGLAGVQSKTFGDPQASPRLSGLAGAAVD